MTWPLIAAFAFAFVVTFGAWDLNQTMIRRTEKSIR